VIWVLVVVVAVLLIAAFLAMLAGRLPYDGMSRPVHSTAPIELPADIGPDDVAALRFDTALRGYRMDQVDRALSLLQKRIAHLEDQLAGGLDTSVGASDAGTPDLSEPSGGSDPGREG
jgi:DivIVA domain-containing protein